MATNTPKKNNGCLWMFLAAVITIFGFGFLKVVGLPTIVSLVASLLIAYFVSNTILGKPPKSYLFGSLLFGFLSIGLLSMLLGIISENWDLTTTETFNNSEQMVRTTMIESNDTIAIYQSNRIWNDNFGNSYTTALTIREQDYIDLYHHISKYKGDYTQNFWGNLYDYIDRTDTPKLDLVLAAFEEIRVSKGLDQMDFAEMVVSCIQDIPYSFVFEGECLPAETYEYSIRKVLENCPECCVGGVAFGIQNPLTFLHSLKGDCDSRTVLIYSVLKHFGYDVAILNSDFYRHSILGINLPASGDYKTYYGKRYVLWETTAKYFKAGDLPASFNDVTHWNVVLTSK